MIELIYMRKIKNIFIILLLCFFLFPLKTSAKVNVEITPHVVDEKLKPRDIRKYDIEIKNNSAHKVNLYAFVNDINPSEGKQEFSSSKLDSSISLAKWIKIKRGALEIVANGEISVPLEIDVSVHAKPGKRYVAITFVEASNRYDAEDIIDMSNQPKLMVNVEISDMAVESAQIKKFKATRNAYVKFPVSFELEVNNFGNKVVEPSGSIYIYNKRGAELGEVKIEAGSFKIKPDELGKIDIDWNSDKAFGKLKAKLRLEYGSKIKRDLQDTVYFWYFPKYFVIISLLVLFGSIFILTFIIFKKTHQGNSYKNEEDKDHVLDLR